MPSEFAQAFSGTARESLFAKFSENVLYSAAGASAVSIAAIIDTQEYDLAFAVGGAGENHEIVIATKSSDTPSLAIGDSFEWNSSDYMVRAVTPDNGCGIVTCRAVRYQPTLKTRQTPFIRRG